MKAFLTALTFIGLTACGASQNASEVASSNAHAPNLYTCQVEGGYTAGYTTTSFAGDPTFHISQEVGNANLSIVNARGEAIELKVEGAQKIVSVSQYIPDLKSTTWELALPEISLDGFGQQAFQTTLKETVVPTSIIGPLPGQQTTVKTMAADCVAQFVNF